MSTRTTAALPACVALCALLAQGCGFDADRLPGIYRIDIQQGNVVTQDMLDRLEPGMDKRRVRFILGTPLITDTFNDDRWDYLYSFQKGGGDRVQRRISVYFAEERLVRLAGDLEAAAARRPPADRPEKVVTVPVREEEGGLLSALTPGFLKRKEGIAEAKTETSTPGTLEAPLTAPLEKAGAKETPAATEAASPSVASVAAPAREVASPAAPAAPADAMSPTSVERDEDAAQLRDLFRGFGTDADTAQTNEEKPGAPAAGTASADAESADQGFFDRLMQRFRRATGATAAQPPESSAPAPAAQ